MSASSPTQPGRATRPSLSRSQVLVDAPFWRASSLVSGREQLPSFSAMQPTDAEKLSHGFDVDEELVMPLPVDSSDEDECEMGEGDACEEQPRADAEQSSFQVEMFLEAVVGKGGSACAGAESSLFDLGFWRSEAAGVGLHVLEKSAASPSAGEDSLSSATSAATQLRQSLDRRGYLQSETLFAGDEEATLAAMRQMLVRLKALGFAPAWIYIFDEAWLVLERCIRLLGDVLVPHAGSGRGAEHLVLEPSIFAHALAKPPALSSSGAGGCGHAEVTGEIARHSYTGGNFGLPHRDHSSADCFDQATDTPVLLSLWCPLTPVTADNGCMFVLPKEHDALLHKPEHPHHLRPFDAASGTMRFGLGGVVALAPCRAGCALAWHGSLVHWGGACSRDTDEMPRASLTAGVRLRTSRATQLQAEQSREALTVDQLPPPLEARVRMIAQSLLVYKWWFPLATSLPKRFVSGTSPSV